MAQVEVALVGTSDRMSAVTTLDSVEDLTLEEGDTVDILAKAVNVLRVKP